MPSYLKISCCAVLTLAGLAGCGVDTLEGDGVDVALNFGTDVEAVTSRGTMAVPTGSGSEAWPWDDAAMTVNAVYYQDMMTSLGQQFMSNQAVAYNTGTWSYSPIKYWPNQGYLDLFAMTPSTGQLAAMMTEKASGVTQMVYYHQPADGVIMRFDYRTLKPVAPPPEVSDLEKPDEGHLNSDENGTGGTNIPTSGKIDDDFPDANLTHYANYSKFRDYTDAVKQPDLMLAHHPHVTKPSVGTKLQFNYTHALMAVRFWLKGKDTPEAAKFCKFRQISDFRLESVTLGHMIYEGHCAAYDITDWPAYTNAEPAGDMMAYKTTVPVKLGYRWVFDPDAPIGHFTQNTNYSLREKYGTSPESPFPLTKEGAWTANAKDTPADGKLDWWVLEQSVPLIPDFTENPASSRTGIGAFLLPPQRFGTWSDGIRVSFTITDDDGTTLTQTLSAPVPMTQAQHDAGGMDIGPGQVLDIYLTFELDGDDYFKFQIDALVNDWESGGWYEQTLTNW